MAMNTHFVFVYGSLMKGFHNHDFLWEAKFIKETTTKDKYRMISMGGFPAVLKTHSDYKIHGEVYEIDDYALEELDHLEGNGSFYKREQIRVDGFGKPVWIYFLIDKGYYKPHDKGVSLVKGNTQRWTKK
jgi:gamma-glutamylaminecyclotransferase